MSSRQSILIVDDRPQNLLALEKTLSALDADVVRAGSGNEALAATLDHDFALAVLDIQMPLMDGFELAELLRGDSRTAHLPIIFLTATYDSDDKMFEGYETGAVDYIVKPYSAMVLLAKARVFLELDAQRREVQGHQQRLETLVQARTQDLTRALAKIEQQRDAAQNQARELDALITERLRAQERVQLAHDVLVLLNRQGEGADTLRSVLRRIRETAGVDAAAIRMRDGDDCPYVVSDGLPEPFMRLENRLCAVDETGKVLRDAQGRPTLECMCGNVLCGRTDPALPFFTKAGSFYSNEMASTASCLTADGRRWPIRNRCNQAGYVSVALIPLRSGSSTVGLLQLADSRPDRFTLDGIEHLEGACASIGIALARNQADREKRTLVVRLEATNQLLQSLLTSVPLDRKLASVTDTIVRVFDADFCRIWLIRPGDLCDRGCPHAAVVEGPHACRDRERCLHLLSSSGRYTHVDGRMHRRVPFDAYKIGRIASGKAHRFLTNDAQNDPQVHDRTWARELGLESFAGYRLRIGAGQTMGVLALFARHAISPDEDMMLDGLSSTVALLAQKALAESARDVLEEQLRASQKMEAIGSLASGVAHDFNNLLSVIQGYTGFALDAVKEGDPVRNELLEVRKAGEKAAALTRQLLAFSRKQVVQPVSLSLNRILTDLEKMLCRIIGEDIDLTLALAHDLGPVLADPGQIEQILMNLVVNARDAMPKGGLLTIETANVELDDAFVSQHVAVTPGPHIRLTVTDSGCGMDAATRARIFEPFFTTKEKGKGTGLGLSTVYGIVKQASGTIWVYSEPGWGTTFKIFFPRVGEVETTGSAIQAPVVRGGTETILLVEDETSVRTLASRILSAVGYTVLGAEGSEQALSTCASHPKIDLVLTDVVMPGMSGSSLVERLQELRPGLKVLFMSGYTDQSLTHHGDFDEAVHFIGKPFTATSLVSKVRELLDEAPEGRLQEDQS